MSDHCIDNVHGLRSTSSTNNRLLEAMNEIMAPLFPLIADPPTAGCDGLSNR